MKLAINLSPLEIILDFNYCLCNYYSTSTFKKGIIMQKTISLPEIYNEKLEKEKKDTGQTFSEIIRRALDYYFERKVDK